MQDKGKKPSELGICVLAYRIEPWMVGIFLEFAVSTFVMRLILGIERRKGKNMMSVIIFSGHLD